MESREEKKKKKKDRGKWLSFATLPDVFHRQARLGMMTFELIDDCMTGVLAALLPVVFFWVAFSSRSPCLPDQSVHDSISTSASH